jgi:hypothetical protein
MPCHGLNPVTVNPGVYPLCRPRGEPSTIADGTLAAVLRASKRADNGALDQIKQVWLYRKTRPSQKEAMQEINEHLKTSGHKSYYSHKHLGNLIRWGRFYLAMPAE